MECDICGEIQQLVKVKNEEGETIYLCQACYETQYEGYEKTETADLDAGENWEKEEEDDEDLLGDEEDSEEEEEK